LDPVTCAASGSPPPKSMTSGWAGLHEPATSTNSSGHVTYLGVPGAPRGEVREGYGLSAQGLRYEAHVPGAGRVRLQVPALETDGEARSRIVVGEGGLKVCYRGQEYAVRLVPPAERALLEDWRAPNRNGVYRVALFEAPGERIACKAELA
ncbi:MAG: hypothetical protein AB7Y46_17405, partial [Armatimonadota bacterium]